MSEVTERMQNRPRNLPAAPPDRRAAARSTAPSADGIAHRISSAGLQISQAADELQQAARGLLEADRAAREAETRWATSDAQLAQAAEKNAELLEALEAARTAKAEADERARRAEQRMQESLGKAEERARTAEQRMQESLGKAEERARTAEQRLQESLGKAEERARTAEQRLQVTVEHQAEMERQLAEIEKRWREAEAQPRVTLLVDDEREELQQTVGAEIRRPLTSILGLTLALKHADPKSADAKNMIKQLTTNARRLDRLVGQMLDLDKIAAGAYTPNRRRTDIEALVRRVVEEAPDLANRDLKVETEHIAINVDPALTEQMVETLLSNAGRRSAPGNPVWIRVSSDQGGVVIAVDDTGPETPDGLRAGKLSASLSDDRGPAARQKKPRGATGLALLARLAELHGGRAWVEERAGGGASFRVFLPDAVQEPREQDTDGRAVDLVQQEEEDEVLFDTAVAGSGLRELSSFDDLTGDIAI